MEGRRGSLAQLSFLHANVSSWSVKARAYFHDSSADVLLISEHHQQAADRRKVELKAKEARRTLVFAPAWPSGKSEHGTTGGQMLQARQHLNFVPVGTDIVEAVVGLQGVASCRWVAGVLRM